jgi:hypothetical protein
MMNLDKWVLPACIVAVLVGIAMIGVASVSSAREFRAACEKDGGVTVYDGRQYQCTAWVQTK